MTKLLVVTKCFIVNEAGDVLVIRRSGTAPRRALEWDFPGGFLEPNEAIDDAVCRETLEETGLEISNPRLIHGFSQYEADINLSGTWLFFVASIPDKGEVSLSSEHDDYRWVQPKELLELIQYDRQLIAVEYALKHDLFHPGVEED